MNGECQFLSTVVAERIDEVTKSDIGPAILLKIFEEALATNHKRALCAKRVHEVALDTPFLFALYSPISS
jgi:hypothetical protein